MESGVHFGVVFVLVKAEDVVDESQSNVQMSLVGQCPQCWGLLVELLVLGLQEILVIVEEAVELR